MGEEGILYLESALVSGVLSGANMLPVVEDALVLQAQGRVVLPNEAYLGWEFGDEWARSLCLPGVVYSSETVAGVKIINGNTANPLRGLARASGLICLFDPRSGRVRTIMAAEPVSAARTAAVSVAATIRLCPRPIDLVAIVGAGPIGVAHALLLADCIPGLRRISFYDAELERAVAAAESTTSKLGGVTEFRAVATLSDVLSGVQVIVAATTSLTPYLTLNLIPYGSVVVNVGLDDVADDALMGADHLVVDSWRLVAGDSRRSLGKLIREGRVVAPGRGEPSSGERRYRVVDAELCDVVTSPLSFRLSRRARVIVNPFGMAIGDVAVAHWVATVARTRNLGQWLGQ